MVKKYFQYDNSVTRVSHDASWSCPLDPYLRKPTVLALPDMKQPAHLRGPIHRLSIRLPNAVGRRSSHRGPTCKFSQHFSLSVDLHVVIVALFFDSVASFPPPPFALSYEVFNDIDSSGDSFFGFLSSVICHDAVSIICEAACISCHANSPVVKP